MFSHNSTTKNQKTSFIIIKENDDTHQNLLNAIEKLQNSDKIPDITKHANNESTENRTTASYKRRKADLTCVICEDKCSGYNFKVISCPSCKSFFHRNACQNLDDIKCLTDTNKCDIKFNNRRRMCKRCRLEKCLSAGMKWDSSARKEKLDRQQQLEENRRLTRYASASPMQTSFPDASLHKSTQLIKESFTVLERPQNSTTDQLPIIQLSTGHQTLPTIESHVLTPDDYDRINLVKVSDKQAFRPTTVKCDISVLGHIINQRSALLYSISVSYDMGKKLITFIRNIPEFQLLNEQDRVTLFKYNSPLVFFMRLCLNYDMNRDLIVDEEIVSEEYAMICNQLSIYCYGEQLHSQLNQLLRSIKKIVDSDPIILQLTMIVLVFAKGAAVEDVVPNEELILINSIRVYEAQSIYASLLFRYMVEKHVTYHEAVCQYSQLIQKTIQMQMFVHKHQTFLQEQLIDTTDEEINPVMKSILRLR